MEPLFIDITLDFSPVPACKVRFPMLPLFRVSLLELSWVFVVVSDTSPMVEFLLTVSELLLLPALEVIPLVIVLSSTVAVKSPPEWEILLIVELWVILKVTSLFVVTVPPMVELLIVIGFVLNR